MGGTMSSFLRDPSQNEVKMILNTIMREMFKRADLVDLYSLADPERCSKYIVVAADAIDQLFAKIRLDPRMGKKGEIYFQAISGIQKKNPMGDKQTVVCKYLAFFFIRIFQIFAALTLSIMDSEMPSVEPEVRQRDRRYPSDVVVINPAQLQGFTQPRRFRQRGGELVSRPFAGTPAAAALPPGDTRTGAGNYYLTDRAGIYKILNFFLVLPDEINSADPMRIEGDFDLTIEQDQLYDNPGDENTRLVKELRKAGLPRPRVVYSFYKDSGRNNTISAALHLNRVADGILNITLKDIELNNTLYAGREQRGSMSGEGKLMRGTDGNRNKFPEYLVELFTKVYETIEPSAFSVIKFLQKHRIIRTLEGKVSIEGSNVTITNPRVYISNRDVPITYSGSTTIDSRQTAYKLTAKLRIEKVRAKAGETRHLYKVIVDFRSSSATPEILNDMINLPSEKSQLFSTGDDDKDVPSSTKNGSTVGNYLQKKFDNVIKKSYKDTGYREGDRGAIRRTKEGLIKPYESSRIPGPFKIERLWKAIAKDPPIKSHCVARAVQLLNASAIRDSSTGDAYSSVCRVNFPYIKDGSLPDPGKSITTEESVYATTMLFVDRIAGPDTMPQLTRSEEFNRFRQSLKYSFERFRSLDETPVPDTIGDIKEKQMEFCRGHDNDKIRVSGKLRGELRTKAAELWNRQKQHISQVMRLIFRLFDEKKVRGGVFEMNPYIMAEGMPAINRLAEEARRVLIAYYSDCEQKYREGLLVLHSNKVKDPQGFRDRFAPVN
jgi:hypothetical protein